ncbi:leucyl-tRNA synthetase [Microthyrium microscopicum]|uniref:leucine--tRNA ligase n=1 Tax=Microthyrium microscopicum TaxID=703497 RepID=A0A6A6UA90_9PEZI|nr:leucyl-tRNA synthetase [Microthyrium microscopicum]
MVTHLPNILCSTIRFCRPVPNTPFKLASGHALRLFNSKIPKPTPLNMAATQDPASHGQATLKLENTEKRDALQAIEQKYQKQWQDQHIYQSNAPTLAEYPGSTDPEELRQKVPKFFGTMAYPYVNGTPHLGHAFTVTKIEFNARVARAQGKRALYPQGYHCTGMPIKACADKLVREVELFGKNFDGFSEEAEEAAANAAVPAPSSTETKADITKFSNVKKGKAALKTIKTKYQFQVMLSMGIPREEIHKFADSNHWLQHFPQLWEEHLNQMGCSIDWRRSFVTTPANPYYNAFVEWQMRRLKELGKIQFGKRYTVYSPKDGQACLDHDRQSGEGVLVQEYLAIKCKVKTWSDAAAKAIEGKVSSGAKVYLVPATLRPETMYGQTNVFVSPKITYGIFKVSDDEYYLITNRGARNMAYQSIFPKWGEFPKVADISGGDVVGTLIEAPLSARKEVYVVPMDTIKDSKGTGVVTSVPSDSPDDYAMTIDLGKKADFYKIKPEWVPQDILPIIETPTYGNLIAEALVKQMKINSPKDAKALAEAKDIAYKEGFYQGKMIYGEFSGLSVQDAKPKARQVLIDQGLAFNYAEPDGLVMSRSGDECTAALLDQWFLTYGAADEKWRDEVLDHVNGKDGLGFNGYTQATTHALNHTLDWMNQWAVTRQFGLGTKLPWDKSQLVESLSDSTIYMAYYTIAPFLHADIFGKTQGTGKISASQMTDEVWDYVFAISTEVKSDIPKETLDAMRREFTYWYPLDVRISGKDLINNHLIFFLYIHQAIWGKKAPQYLPKGIRMNGHAMLNGEKMSKSTGNFLSLSDGVKKFGADACRVALADAGDGLEDANFEETVANAVILKLFELRKWIEEVIGESRVLKDGEDFVSVKEAEKPRNLDLLQRTGKKLFWDELFENELNMLAAEAIKQYSETNYKAALLAAYYDFTSARDTYRIAANSSGVGMHQDLIRRYVDLQARLLAPIAPHWCDYIWQEVLKNKSTVTLEVFPTVPAPKPELTAALEYVRATTSSIGSAEGAQAKKLAKGKSTHYDPKADKKLTIYVAQNWPAWQAKYIELVRQQVASLSVMDMKVVSKQIDKQDMKKAMPFVQMLKRKLDTGESSEAVLERKLLFDEVTVAKEMASGLLSTVPKLKIVDVVLVDEGGKTGTSVSGERKEGLGNLAASAEPGTPSFEFSNV